VDLIFREPSAPFKELDMRMPDEICGPYHVLIINEWKRCGALSQSGS
jgi:hypothetical protein